MDFLWQLGPYDHDRLLRQLSIHTSHGMSQLSHITKEGWYELAFVGGPPIYLLIVKCPDGWHGRGLHLPAFTAYAYEEDPRAELARLAALPLVQA